MAAYRLTSRVGPKVQRDRFATLEEALTALEARIGSVPAVPGRTVLRREYDPAQQIAGRFELRAPGRRRGGVDVRGDGSAEAFEGWIRKRVVPRAPGETAAQALARALDG